MGVSGRTTNAIEPKNADLLIPGHRPGRTPARPRDIEDASFEILGSADEVSPPTRAQPQTGGKPRQVFKSRLTQSHSEGPFPRDFASPDPAPIIIRPESGERLGVFANGSSPAPGTGSRLASAGAALALTVCAVAAAAFWMAGGHSLVLAPPAQMQASGPAADSIAPAGDQQMTGQRVGAGVAALPEDVVMTPDPVITGSTQSRTRPDAPAAGASAEVPSQSFVDIKPRPARIERAGSILMIRPRSE